MKILIELNESKERVSPYMFKLIMEKLYKDDTFKYIIDKILFLETTADKGNDLGSGGRFQVFYHLKGCCKSHGVIPLKRAEKKIHELLDTGNSLVKVEVNGNQVIAEVGNVIQNEKTSNLSIHISDMLLDLETGKNGKMVQKVFNADIVNGVLDLRGIHPETKKQPGHEVNSIAELFND